MNIQKSIAFALFIAFAGCGSPEKNAKHLSEFAAVSQVESGKPVSVMLTAYSTTLLADGIDNALLRIAVTDSLGREITSASDSVGIYVTGHGTITLPDGTPAPIGIDTAGINHYRCRLTDGVCHMIFVAGEEPDRVKVEARVGKLWPGAHEIHTIPRYVKIMLPASEQLKPTLKPIDRMIGADISWLPELEARGRKFYDNGQEMEALQLLKKHGFNTIRLRTFVNPENEKGYSPGKGYCGLDSTLAMALRVKNAGMKLLLDYHYSDYWADPQQQNKPLAWADLDYDSLRDSVRRYTARVLLRLQAQGTMPDMVQVGNEINHGILWPEGHIGDLDGLAGLLKAGVEGINEVNKDIPIMMHVALGGQNKEAVFWFDNMIARGVEFDIIGLSYYPRWHGTLDDLKANLLDLKERYKKPLNVVEYSHFKKEVHDIVFNLPDEKGRGACIWEPLSWMGTIVDREGNVMDVISVYDQLRDEYLEIANPNP